MRLECTVVALLLPRPRPTEDVVETTDDMTVAWSVDEPVRIVPGTLGHLHERKRP